MKQTGTTPGNFQKNLRVLKEIMFWNREIAIGEAAVRIGAGNQRIIGNAVHVWQLESGLPIPEPAIFIPDEEIRNCE